MTAKEIRDSFKQFFESKQHEGRPHADVHQRGYEPVERYYPGNT